MPIKDSHTYKYTNKTQAFDFYFIFGFVSIIDKDLTVT